MVEVASGPDAGRSGGDKASIYMEELLSMHLQVRVVLSQVKQEHENVDAPSKAPFKKKLEEFRKMWRYCDLSSEVPEYRHVCVRCGPKANWCCQDNEEPKKKMATTLVAIACDALPDVPQPGKWTKTWSVLAFNAPRLSVSMVLHIVELVGHVRTMETSQARWKIFELGPHLQDFSSITFLEWVEKCALAALQPMLLDRP